MRMQRPIGGEVSSSVSALDTVPRRSAHVGIALHVSHDRRRTESTPLNLSALFKHRKTRFKSRQMNSIRFKTVSHDSNHFKPPKLATLARNIKPLQTASNIVEPLPNQFTMATLRDTIVARTRIV